MSLSPNNMNTYIVTIKMPPNPEHDQNNKKVGKCPASGHFCTDTTGQHHSFIFNSNSAKDAREHWQRKGQHVTRVEQV